ncbi:PREDICTED: F-box protein At5g07610-like [Fragaria vesca subsp. vesca]|uniref:F-box protein At5g07610-like n=1 Tax=Fragaria vesca subsp. vesca TaxID=101020 RepID=UPI0002C37763|nr:PREDICTED: F-box protein At5g07610-like [Fragaria vesca subsp. vesca]
MVSRGRKSSKLIASSRAAEEVVKSTDLLSEILLRLPAKPVLKFKLVSKQWCSIICTPEFTVLYAKRNPNPHLGFMLHARLDFQPQPRAIFLDLGGYQYDKLPNFLNISKMEIHHVCNGLLCYSRPHLSSPNITSYYICNHSSGQSEFQRVLVSPDNETVKAFNVAFDPKLSPHYRLVFVRELPVLDETRLIKIDIYSSKTKSWRASRKGIYILQYDIGFHVSVYWKDAMYWYNEKNQSLAYFDFNDDTVEILPKPKVTGGTMKCYYLGESGGHLHLVGAWRPWTSLLTVFELKEDRSGWNVKYHGDFRALANSFPKMLTKNPRRPYMFSVVNLVRGEREGELIIVMIIPEGVISYNIRERSLKKLLDLALSETYMEQLTFRSHQYIETLASI